jgi:hypothetical protein
MCDPKLYEIRVQGHLQGDWRDWFGAMTMHCLPNGELALFGPVADQAALFGMLARIRDLGLTLVAVNQVSTIPAFRSHSDGCQ